MSLKHDSALKLKTQVVIILIDGFQGSGKSSLISRIKEIYDANIISTDVIRQSLFNKGVKISPEFSKYVSHIYINLLKNSLSKNSNILLDANAHAKRIEEVEKLLKEHYSQYKIVKIFLDASEKTLRNRIKNRKSAKNSYQGTEKDLEAALISTKINLADYDVIIDTDRLNEKRFLNWLVNLYSLISKSLKLSANAYSCSKTADICAIMKHG